MANPNIVNVGTITLENNFVDITTETTTTILTTVSDDTVVRLKEVRVSENSASTTAVTLNYYDAIPGTSYPIVNNHNIPLGSTSVIFSGVLHVKEGDSITITTDDPDGTTVDVTVTVTYEVLS